VDPYYKKMMIGIAIALALTIIVALVIVELVIRAYGP
jgi:hypothetical protein